MWSVLGRAGLEGAVAVWFERNRVGWGGRGRAFGDWFLDVGGQLMDYGGLEAKAKGEMVPWSLGLVEDVRRGMRVEREGRRRRVVQNMAG